ncbi:MAG: hypothetical protein GYB65_04970 [Chloroflexi bacterium]|nr:hypothetical protein [Chloroflexota bacterium]
MFKRFISFMVLLLLLVACSGDSDGIGLSGSGLDPSPQLTLDEAVQVATTFLEAWENEDYEAMYSLIMPNSQAAYSLDDFTAEYGEAMTQLTTSSLETETTNALQQGTTVQINYNVTFQTGFFGEVVDNGRTMRLRQTSDGWRVAWMRTDIFAEYAPGTYLQVNRTQPRRGNILDRNGNVLANQDGIAVMIRVAKQDIPNDSACIELLADLMNRDYGEVEEQFAQYNPDTIFPVGEIDPETFQANQNALLQVCDVGDDDLDTSQRPTRRYFGSVAPHIVGYVGRIQPEQTAYYQSLGYPDSALVGQEGIERSYESYLAGTIGGELVIVANTGEALRTIASVDSEPAQNVYLTIDRDLQGAVVDAFQEAYTVASPTWGPTSPGAAAVVMDVNTGEVLAAVSYPGYDPGLFNPDTPIPNPGTRILELNSDPRTPLLNRVTRGLYAPGSVFKIISMAAGLDSGVYEIGTSYFCEGIWYGAAYGDGVDFRTDWIHPGSHGWLDFIGGLTNSCDPYFWQLGVNLYNTDPYLLPDYASLMGLGVSTGLTDLPEDIGYIPNPDDYQQRTNFPFTIGTTLNLVIGQDQILATPLQIARMTAAIANGGTLYQPQFVSKVQLLNEPPVYQSQPTPISVLDFDPEVFAAIQTSMCDVTLAPTGTARYIFEPWYSFQNPPFVVCGKTGTAQTGGEGVPPQAWFVAFVPGDNPEIAIAVIVENSCEGSEVAAPLTRRIIEDYYGMPHSSWPELWTNGCQDLGE